MCNCQVMHKSKQNLKLPSDFYVVHETRTRKVCLTVVSFLLLFRSFQSCKQRVFRSSAFFFTWENLGNWDGKKRSQRSPVWWKHIFFWAFFRCCRFFRRTFYKPPCRSAGVVQARLARPQQLLSAAERNWGEIRSGQAAFIGRGWWVDAAKLQAGNPFRTVDP